MGTKTRALFIALLAVVLSGTLAGAVWAKPGGPGPGNSPNAKACQKGGWQTLYTSTGDRFASGSQCVSYASGGGTLLTSPPTRTLTVSTAGGGAGTVTGSGIDCGVDCTESHPLESTVSLTASPAAGSTFAGWSGACSGMSCTVTMSADQSVVATFELLPTAFRTLTVSKTGTGGGTVTGSGIDCGVDCTEDYADGAGATLTADAAEGSTFTGWSGDCTGMTCTLSMTADRTAVANFDTTPTPPQMLPAIFLGYADDFTVDGTPPPYVPGPWLGDPGVTFLGCTTDAACGSSYNAGAIMIQNPASNTSSITLVSASVNVGDPANGGCHWQIWDVFLEGGAATAARGGMIILTQTGLLGPEQPVNCRESVDPVWWGHHNFNTSLRPGDTQTPRFYNCDLATGIAPVITLGFSDGTTLTVTDVDKVLNTGGRSRAACEAANQATMWTPVTPANIVVTP